MSSDRTSQALRRIDAALARIESAPRAHDPEVEAKYATLRAATENAVKELDALIAGGAR